MKKLSLFETFDFDRFSEGKLYKVINVSEWTDFNSKVHLGTRVNAVIAKDETVYRTKDGETSTNLNLYERISFKVAKDINVPAGAYIMPVNAVAVVYGSYRNQISVTAENIRILQTKATT